MDIKAKINELVEKIKADPKLLSSFKSDPVKTVKTLVGNVIPDNSIDAVVTGIKAKLGDNAGALGGIGDALKKLF